MKLPIYFCALFFGLINQAFSQSTDSIFEKDVFMIRIYEGKRSFLKSPVVDTIKPDKNSFSVRIDYAPISYTIVPDPGKWRLALYVDDPLNNKCYYYNDIFLTPGYDEAFKAAKDENNICLRAMGGRVVKMWRIKALWKRETVSKKPDWFKSWVTDLLTFNEYHIYTLHQLISIKAITTNEGDNWISVGKDTLLKPYD